MQPSRIQVLLLAALSVAMCALSGCQRSGQYASDPIRCGDSVVLNDFHRTLLLEYDARRALMFQRDSLGDPKVSIGQAQLLCEVGGIAYTTQARMSASSHSVLHVRAHGRERTVAFTEGINAILPLSPDKLLVQTQQVRRGPRDPSLGDLSVEESGSILGPPLPAASAAVLGTDRGGHLYLDDVVVRVSSLRRVMTTRGPMGPLWLQGGRFVFHSIDGEVFEIQPETGRRKRLQTYTVADDRWPVEVRTTANGAARYYVHRDDLYAVSVAPTSHPQPGPQLRPNAVLRFDPLSRSWVVLAEFAFPATAFALVDDDLVMVGKDRMAVFHIPSRQLRVLPLPLDGREPVSVAAFDAGWLIATYGPGPGRDQAASQADLWVVSKDGPHVLLRHPLPGMGPVRLSTQRTPIHQW